MVDNRNSSIVHLPPYAREERPMGTPYNIVDGPTFIKTIDGIYENIVRWMKNLFMLPSGKAGKEFIRLNTEWMNIFNNHGIFQAIALKVVMVLPGLLLQKPSSKSKAKEHTKLLEERLRLWKNGQFNELHRQARTIQQKLKSGKRRTNDDIVRIFSKLMFEGKVSAALKFLDENAHNAVLDPNEEVLQPQEISKDALIKGPLMKINPAKYFDIDEQLVLKAANTTKGSGGPSQLDAQQWKRMPTSNQFKNEAKDFRDSLACFAKKIASEFLDPSTLQTYVANRLIPLHKNPGEQEIQIRPIGVGEVMRRIVGKTISWSLKEDIQKAAGPLQVSCGLEGGSEAAIHAMKTVFENDATDGVILVDAENAFNKLNRMVALHNMQYLCPVLAIVLINTYREPARLFVVGGGEILSMEGSTQGDTLAMAFYGISTKPILLILRNRIPEITQVWFADDATGGGNLYKLRKWWDEIKESGTKYGYHVKPSKSYLILKDSSKLDEAKQLFETSPINITTDGKRHLGAAIGSEEFKDEYINNKVNEWCKQVKGLANIAKSQPHAAYAALYPWRAA